MAVNRDLTGARTYSSVVLVYHEILAQTYKYITRIFSTQAVKKGASQTVIGLIFGCYAVCNLIGSLVLGKYVSIWHYFLSVHIKWSVILPPTHFLFLCHCVRLFKLVQSSCLWWGFLCRQAAPLCLGKCWSCVPLYANNDDGNRNILSTVISWLIKLIVTCLNRFSGAFESTQSNSFQCFHCGICWILMCLAAHHCYEAIFCVVKAW